MGLLVWALGMLRVRGLGFGSRVLGLWFRREGFGFKTQKFLGFGVKILGSRFEP